MSFLKRLFGGGSPAEPAAPAADPVEYNGYTILPTPFVEDGQHQTCGVISKRIGDEVKEHRFIRADRFASRDDAINVTIRKAQQVIDEQGDRLFG
jgi:hypothetical protein